RYRPYVAPSVPCLAPGPSCLPQSLFSDTAPTEIYTLSLHDALPILISLGVEILALSIDAIKPSPEIARALEAEAREEILRQADRSEEHTSELQSRENLVCRLLLEKKNTQGRGTH